MSLYGWFLPLVDSSRPYLKPTVEAAKAKALKSLDYLEKVLADRTFLVGDRITLADLHVYSVLGPAFATVLDADFRKSHPNVTRHFQTVAHQPQVLEVVGQEPTLCEKAAVYTPPKKEEKPKAAPAPKEDKPKAAPAPAADDVPAEAPKPKHPCEALGPAKSFPLDEWKRQVRSLPCLFFPECCGSHTADFGPPLAVLEQRHPGRDESMLWQFADVEVEKMISDPSFSVRQWLDEHYDETAAQEYSFCRADFKVC